MATGSATGNPRNKVALKPGHSLMDWIRLGNSGKDLTGVNGVFTDVTKAELAQHKSVEDAWLSIRGVVYNVTHYMDFHPGGCDEMMRGVGTDATSLFNQVHAWVNHESILKKCVVGRLGSTGEDNVFTISTSPSKSVSSSLRIAAINKVSHSQMDWFQQLAFIVLVFYSKAQTPKVQILLSEPDILRCKINARVETYHLEGKVRWPCNISISLNGKIQIKLLKKKPSLWKTYGINENKTDSNTSTSSSSTSSLMTEPLVSDSDYWAAEITKVIKVTHDTYLIRLKYNKDIFNFIPPGCHIFVKQSIKGDEVIRPYTPVPLLSTKVNSPSEWRHSDEEVNLLVKSYQFGQMSSWLCSRRSGTTVYLSDPKGSFSVSAINNFNYIYLFAAGSGITPMLSIIVWLLHSTSDKKITLLFFNKTRKDIIWQKEFEDLASENNRFTVEHILSEPDPEWSGKRGHVTFDLVQTFLPQHSNEVPINDYICICGPRPFTLLIEKWLKEDLGYSHENYYSFLGQQ